ncbi:cell wall protein Ecm33 [Elasticomyces elasticus]|nr:cell wall protein Ecm33 [Elasticomyces elasticus]
MSVLRYIVPALAAAGRLVAAQCSAATTTIQNQADASALASCTTFTGSIAIASSTTDNIALNGIQKIDGSLIANNVTQMTQLSASSLETITHQFGLNGLTILSTLNFPRLTNVDTIQWEALPALQGLSFTTGVQTAASVSIQNTELNSLNGINLQVVDKMIIANNPYLNDITAHLGNITTALTVEANGRNLSVNFPNLLWAFNMTFRNCSRVNIPSLASLNGSLGFYSNEIQSLMAPNLTTVGGSLSFVSNTMLTNISLPSLTTVNGGFQLANNTMLASIDGFPHLKTVAGALDFNGNFTNVSLPAITDIRGAFNMQSSGDISSACSMFSSLSGQNNVIKGKFTCAGGQSKPGGAGTSPTGTSGGSSSTSTVKGSANALMVASTSSVGFMGVLAAIFGLL